MLKLSFVVTLIIAGVSVINAGKAAPGSQVCYDYVGCFSNTFPHNNTANYLPDSPDEIQTEFVLFTHTNPTKRQYISYKDENSIKNSNFDRNRPLKIITHGFSNTIEKEWMHEMKDELLKSEDLNVILVGWGKGCEFPDYTRAATNIRTVAKELNLLLTSIEDIYDIHTNAFKIHCIGHSLGAQLCGLTGQESEIRFDRISALDPAGPFFENADGRVSVDKSDAEFVDVMHTNGGDLLQSRFGMVRPCGHIDFYVNGGVFQPGCPNLLQITIGCLTNFEACKGDPSRDIGCSHNRAYSMYIESINSPCYFRSHVCKDSNAYENGECTECEKNGCPAMGYHANEYYTLGPHYLSTASSSPYCAKQYLFEATVSRRAKKTKGEITVSLNNDPAISVMSLETDFYPDTKVGKVFVTNNHYSGETEAKMQFRRKPTLFGKNPESETLTVDKIRIVNLDEEAIMSICQKSYLWKDRDYIETTLGAGDCRV